MTFKFADLITPLDKIIALPFVWKFIDHTIIRFSKSLERRKNGILIHRLYRELERDPCVRLGPFKGMRYAKLEATCSAMLPKLLGTYESELHFILDDILVQPYKLVVDIGSAEGYYAIGLALGIPGCTVVAFDSEPFARSLCHQNVMVNNLSDRIEIRGYADRAEISSLCQGRRSLIVCDCEGFEYDFFLGASPNDLRDVDILIETHDFIREGVCQEISDLFSKTHSVRLIHSIDDPQKSRTYVTPFTVGMDESVKQLIYAEGRPVIMSWLFMTPINKRV